MNLHHNNNNLWTYEEINQHMWCECPIDVGGRLCDIPKEQCDDEMIVCFHGGSCVSTLVQDAFGHEETEYHCDCTTASTETTNLVAGRYCQYEATKVCSEDDGNLL